LLVVIAIIAILASLLLPGLARAKELLFLGERVSAEEAVRLGLANRVVPGDKLLDEAMDLARRLAALPAVALRGTKRAVNLHLEQAMATVIYVRNIMLIMKNRGSQSKPLDR